MVDVENDVRINECRDWNVEGTCKYLSKLLMLYDTKNQILVSVIASIGQQGAQSQNSVTVTTV